MSFQQNQTPHLQQVKRELDQVSSCFCLAKWLQVTIDLNRGTNHSCHHPKRQPIQREDLKDNPSALHNTSYKKSCRKMMLEGERPPECSFCWKIEDSSSENFSDRIIKSSAEWSLPHLGKVQEKSWTEDINPSYLEIMFDNACNFSCLYCTAENSSAIDSEMKKYGPLQTSTEGIRAGPDPDEYKIEQRNKHDQENPYIKAFWRWWPNLVADLKVLRLTGGEPLLNGNTFQILDFIDQNPLPNITLAINSNLGISNQKFYLCIEKIKKLIESKKVLKVQIFTSIDTHGEQAEYIRHGLDYQQFQERVHFILHHLPQVEVVFMVTLNILSIPRFHLLLKDVLALKRLYPSRVGLDINHLTSPQYLSLKIIDSTLLNTLKDHLLYMMDHHNKGPEEPEGLSTIEIEKMRRIVNWCSFELEQRLEPTQIHNNDLVKLRTDFYLFLKDCDRRKNSNLEKIFPELKQFVTTISTYFHQKKLTLLKHAENNFAESINLCLAMLLDIPALIYSLDLDKIRFLLENTHNSLSHLHFPLVNKLVQSRERQTQLLWNFFKQGTINDGSFNSELYSTFLDSENHIYTLASILDSHQPESAFSRDFQEIKKFSIFSRVLFIYQAKLHCWPSFYEDCVAMVLAKFQENPNRYKELSDLIQVAQKMYIGDLKKNAYDIIIQGTHPKN